MCLCAKTKTYCFSLFPICCQCWEHWILSWQSTILEIDSALKVCLRSTYRPTYLDFGGEKNSKERLVSRLHCFHTWLNSFNDIAVAASSIWKKSCLRKIKLFKLGKKRSRKRVHFMMFFPSCFLCQEEKTSFRFHHRHIKKGHESFNWQ